MRYVRPLLAAYAEIWFGPCCWWTITLQFASAYDVSEEEANFEVVAEAEHGLEAIEKAKFHKPHLIVLDFQMPVMNGMEAAPKIREHCPHVCIIMLTMFGNEELEAAARAVGVHAFVSKSKAGIQLIPAANALFEQMTPADSQHAHA